MPNLCEQIKVFVGLIPRRKTSKKCREPKWNKVFREQEQYEQVQGEEKNEEAGQGWLVYRSSEVHKNIYQTIEKVLLEQGWTNMWIKRCEIQAYIPERQWDLRWVNDMHKPNRIGDTKIQYRKQNNRIEYRLVL
jgi:hypothetical protein